MVEEEEDCPSSCSSRWPTRWARPGPGLSSKVPAVEVSPQEEVASPEASDNLTKASARSAAQTGAVDANWMDACVNSTEVSVFLKRGGDGPRRELVS